MFQEYSADWNQIVDVSFVAFKCQDFYCLLENRVLHKKAWAAKLLGTHLSIQGL